jgi:hypothetical protein
MIEEELSGLKILKNIVNNLTAVPKDSCQDVYPDLVEHELRENLLRTQNNMDYNSAHNATVEMYQHEWFPMHFYFGK